MLVGGLTKPDPIEHKHENRVNHGVFHGILVIIYFRGLGMPQNGWHQLKVHNKSNTLVFMSIPNRYSFPDDHKFHKGSPFMYKAPNTELIYSYQAYHSSSENELQKRKASRTSQ